MIKPVKRNKRISWIKSRYSRYYRAELFLYKSQVAQLIACNKVDLQDVYRSGRSKPEKLLKIVLLMTDLTEAFNKLKTPKGRVKNDAHIQPL